MATEDRCPQCGEETCDCSPEVQAEAARRAAAGEDKLVIASDQGQVSKRSKAAATGARRDDDDLNWLMRHPQGRRIMWGLLENSGLYRNAAVEGGFSANETFFKAGQQNIGQFYLQRTVTLEPDAYNLMVKENSGSKQ